MKRKDAKIHKKSENCTKNGQILQNSRGEDPEKVQKSISSVVSFEIDRNFSGENVKFEFQGENSHEIDGNEHNFSFKSKKNPQNVHDGLSALVIDFKPSKKCF